MSEIWHLHKSQSFGSEVPLFALWKTFSEDQPLDDLRIEHAKAVQIIKLLCEGVSVRAAARLIDTGNRRP